MKNQIGNIDLTPLSDEQLETASRKQLLVLLRGEQKVRRIFQEAVEESEAREQEMKEKLVFIEGHYYKIRSLMFCPKSERSKPKRTDTRRKPKAGGSPVPKLPSERYPQADIIEKHITADKLPNCRSCGLEMSDSGLTETSEYLTVIPKQYIVIRQHRHIYRCRCHGDLVTTPAIPKVVPGGSYSDEMAIDVSLSKYCDLIPVERYSQMAKRQGFAGIPPQSLIGLSQKLAEFFRGAYELIKAETLTSPVLLADETPHRMLEGDEREGWYLWGFSQPTASFFECHPSRSGEVASIVLDQSRCEILVSDVYSGYRRAIREANKKRSNEGRPEITAAYCNAHARRGFKGIAEEDTEDALFMIEQYKEIYRIDDEAKSLPPSEQAAKRDEMKPYFLAMKAHAASKIEAYSSKSGIARGFNYFLKNFEGLTACLRDQRIPLDNNASERLLRSHVIGRKTWYGTHSKVGAETAAIHFTLIETCKLNRINPRAYYTSLLNSLHAGKGAFTPYQWSKMEEPPDA